MQESDTVKKLISTILPQAEEVFIPSPFPQGFTFACIFEEIFLFLTIKTINKLH
jgi:hypothetical protein